MHIVSHGHEGSALMHFFLLEEDVKRLTSYQLFARHCVYMFPLLDQGKVSDLASEGVELVAQA